MKIHRIRNLLLIIVSFFLCSACFAQNDFIVIKKRAHTIKTLFPGSQASFTTSERYFSGYISAIENDSLLLLEYDVRKVPTTVGVYILDTIGRYSTKIFYKDILQIYNPKYGFDITSSGATLLGGGILLTTVGLGTWIFTKEGDQYHASPKLVIGSALLGAAGYGLLKLNNGTFVIGKKFRLNYINTK